MNIAFRQSDGRTRNAGRRTTLACDSILDNLLLEKEYSGAYYLAGLAIECAIKAVIAKRMKRHHYPVKDSHKFYTHDPATLVGLAELDLGSQESADQKFGQYWATVKDWKVDCRYDVIDRQAAVDLYKAITARRHGVLQWLRKNW